MLNSDRLKIEEKEKWNEWIPKIPFLNFPKSWKVKIIPPSCGALVRFIIQTNKMEEKSFVSIYLDVDQILGYWNGPYWEVHPVDNDVIRCDMNNTEQLLKNIKKAIRQIEKRAQKIASP